MYGNACIHVNGHVYRHVYGHVYGHETALPSWPPCCVQVARVMHVPCGEHSWPVTGPVTGPVAGPVPGPVASLWLALYLACGWPYSWPVPGPVASLWLALWLTFYHSLKRSYGQYVSFVLQ